MHDSWPAYLCIYIAPTLAPCHAPIPSTQETEDSLHLDINVDILSTSVSDVHGILGQTVAWALDNAENMAVTHNHTVQGAESDYEVAEGLLGTGFVFTRFAGKPAPASDSRRALIARGVAVGLSV